MKKSLALVECLLILGAFGTRGVSLFGGVFSGSGVDPPSDCLFSNGVSNICPGEVVQKSTCTLLIADLFFPQF